jgi:shikimate dehydrogenase
MTYALMRAGIEIKGKEVLILGSGGTSNTALAVTKSLGAKSVTVVSRSGEVNYENCYELKNTNVVINTTPVGMFPNNYERVIDLSRFSALDGAFDAIYNPSLTEFLYQAKGLGVNYSDGLPMLVAQAKYAMDLFLGKESSDDIIEKVISKIRNEVQNIVLIGMPGSGKSTIGKRLAEILGKEFIDTDQKIVEEDGRDIPTIFRDSGEEYFRKLESKVLKEVGKLAGKVIATGGGVVKNEENYFPLKQNGVIIWIKRPLDKLSIDNRPLSQDGKIAKLFEDRKDLYLKFSDYSVNNEKDIQTAVKGVLEIL